MDDRVQDLIRQLEALSPMPADDSPELTKERLDAYVSVVDEIDTIVRSAGEGADVRFIWALIRSFGYGDGYESYWSVLHTLEQYPSHLLRPALREALQEEARGARMWSAYMLGCHRNPEDVPTLITALQDPEYKVRYKALQTLAMIGDRSAELAMAALLDDPVEEVRRAAERYLQKLMGQR